jgi:hypothetical protein
MGLARKFYLKPSPNQIWNADRTEVIHLRHHHVSYCIKNLKKKTFQAWIIFDLLITILLGNMGRTFYRSNIRRLPVDYRRHCERMRAQAENHRICFIYFHHYVFPENSS